MRIQEFVVEDELYNPFATQTDESTTLKFEKTDTNADLKMSNLNTWRHTFVLDPEKLVGKRIHYSLWHGLGDVGGLHDGLRIIF